MKNLIHAVEMAAIEELKAAAMFGGLCEYFNNEINSSVFSRLSQQKLESNGLLYNLFFVDCHYDLHAGSFSVICFDLHYILDLETNKINSEINEEIKQAKIYNTKHKKWPDNNPNNLWLYQYYTTTADEIVKSTTDYTLKKLVKLN